MHSNHHKNTFIFPLNRLLVREKGANVYSVCLTCCKLDLGFTLPSCRQIRYQAVHVLRYQVLQGILRCIGRTFLFLFTLPFSEKSTFLFFIFRNPKWAIRNWNLQKSKNLVLRLSGFFLVWLHSFEIRITDKRPRIHLIIYKASPFQATLS